MTRDASAAPLVDRIPLGWHEECHGVEGPWTWWFGPEESVGVVVECDDVPPCYYLRVVTPGEDEQTAVWDTHGRGLRGTMELAEAIMYAVAALKFAPAAQDVDV